MWMATTVKSNGILECSDCCSLIGFGGKTEDRDCTSTFCDLKIIEFQIIKLTDDKKKQRVSDVNV